MTADAILNYANIFTSTKFATIDAEYGIYSPNLRSATFRSEEVGYLAGTLAGMMSQSNIIGDLGGMEIPPVTAFVYGYANGAQCANPEVTTIISYTNDFSNPDLGAEYAQGMISQGADVIFAAAGATGSGALITTTQAGLWAIGVDTDQFYTVFMSGTIPGADYLLSSAMKRYDNAVYYTISDTVAGAFSPGLVVYDLADGGVGLAPFHEAENSIPPKVIEQLDWVTRGLIGGVLEPLNPDGPCLFVHQQYLPLTSK
jgi:basic membrane protein A